MSALRSIVWVLHFVGLAIAAFWLAWWMLTPVDFGFRWGYRLLDIDAHIAEFAPQNMYKKGYESTLEEERFSHFSAIVSAINAGGNGLADIRYHPQEEGSKPDAQPTGFVGYPAQFMLHEAEIIHLQDVANLVSLFHMAGPLMLVLWITTLLWAKYRAWPFPGSRQVLMGGTALLALCGAIVVLTGPTQVFYWLHTRIFPEEHQWFFYYQESLMTTLMKAPDLFGFIAILWVSLSVAVMAALVFFARKFAR